MAKTRAIVKRRKAVRNIRKITRTMELIATARFRKAMDRATQADAFTKKMAELVSDLSASGASAEHPLLKPRPQTKNSILLVLTANRGLCGGYNSNASRLGLKSLEEAQGARNVQLEVSGKRGINFFRYRGVTATHSYTQFEDKPSFEEVEPIAQRYLTAYLSGEIDRLDVAYTRFVSMGRQIAEVATLLPFADLPSATPTAPVTKKSAGEYLFLPSSGDILEELVPMSFKVRLFKCFLDAAVSEQIARMVAMKGATENAGNLLRDLNMLYNRARQSQITSELSEIIGTAEALK
ncbi:ATP synthase F1 subunit gamma [bacterium]|jgi:F-type H+-transporting ATPase subunit gamma|nr:ATP synthase F1 subunit gamma [bacterium]